MNKCSDYIWSRSATITQLLRSKGLLHVVWYVHSVCHSPYTRRSFSSCPEGRVKYLIRYPFSMCYAPQRRCYVVFLSTGLLHFTTKLSSSVCQWEQIVLQSKQFAIRSIISSSFYNNINPHTFVFFLNLVSSS